VLPPVEGVEPHMVHRVTSLAVARIFSRAGR
jgi:hypothetical protein